MNNYTLGQLHNIGRKLKTKYKTWFELTSQDEWDSIVEKNEFTKDQLGLIKQAFDGKPFINPNAEADVVMPFGVHKDKKISQLNLDYLIYLRKQDWLVKWPVVHDWITRHKDLLDKEEKETEEAHVDLKAFAEQLKK